MRPLWELLLIALADLLARAAMASRPALSSSSILLDSYCLSWRVAVEANNMSPFRTVPSRCLPHVEGYMLGGQYSSDLAVVVDQISDYSNKIAVSDDGMDSWVLDVDDTCISNLPYYKGKHYGGDPFDPVAFKSWAQKGLCPVIPGVLVLYQRLIEGGFKVFLLTGRDEETLGRSTAENLHLQGFVGHERLIMRSSAYRGQSAVVFKGAMRKQLVAEGYRLRGNVGDQWSDLLGDCAGDRTFKLPNPMYFVP